MTAPRRLNLRQELALALLPRAVVLLMLCGVEVFSRQWLLFASLASGAFLMGLIVLLVVLEHVSLRLLRRFRGIV